MPKKKDSKAFPKKKRFKFNIKEILKERQKDIKLSEERAETEEQMKTIDDLFQKEVKSIFNDDGNEIPVVSSELDLVVDSSKYNIPFSKTSYRTITKSCSRRLIIMSIEQNELQTNIHYNHLMSAKWSPRLYDVRRTLLNWNMDLDNIIFKPLPKHKINDNQQVGRHNFEFVIKFIIQSILRNNKFKKNDLLILAKFAVAIYFDHHCGHMFNVIKKLFSTCIEKALPKKETDITIYAQELYSKYEVHLLKMTSDLFLPLESQIMKKIYAYLTFKIYKSLTGKVDSIIEFPSNNEWFIQDLVDKNYFNQNPNKVFKHVVQLLEHVVVAFDLYKEEQKLSDMYDFLYNIIIKLTGLSKSQNLLSILDHWKLQLFRLHVKRKLL